MKKYSFETLDSTNDEAKRIIRRGEAGNFYVLGAEQTSGRGQFGRSFFSPGESGLYISVCVRHASPHGSAFITQAAAVAVAASLSGLCSVELDIKPVNDLMLGGRKVGGILVESDARYGEAGGRAIIGIGLNLYPPAEGFPAGIAEVAGYIFERPAGVGGIKTPLSPGEEEPLRMRDGLPGSPKDKLVALLAGDIARRLSDFSADFQSGEIVSDYLGRAAAYERGRLRALPGEVQNAPQN